MKLSKKTLIFLSASAIFFILNYILQIYVNISWHSYYVDIMRLIIQPLMMPLCIIFAIITLIFMVNDILKTRQVKVAVEDSDIEKLRKRLIEDKVEQEQNKDILELMLTNMSEIKQYYSMSKRHAQLSFILALFFCIFGFVLIAFVVTLDTTNTQPVIVGIIGGTISELFAGTALLVHRSSISQLNHYYKSLHENERFLSTVNLVSRLPDDKQFEAVMKIIESSLKDISSLVNDTK